MSDRPLSAVILAAGLGTRMRSRKPKVLHELVGRPMIDIVLDSCRQAGISDATVVIAASQPEVAEHLSGVYRLVRQAEQRGTGHALAQVPGEDLGRGDVLVINGDCPLLRPETIARVVEVHQASGRPATLTTVDDPGRADGRVVRAATGELDRIVEHRDAGPELRDLSEINVGLYCFDGASLVRALARLAPDNRAGELYLTDVFQHLRPAGVVMLDDAGEGLGINDRIQLAQAEAILRRRLLEELMRSGVTVRDPASTYVDAEVQVGSDTVLEPGTSLRGRTVIGSGCTIGPNTDIKDSSVDDGAVIIHSWLDGVEFGAGSDCGPYVKLRPGTRIDAGVHIGSFAEIARSSVGRGSAVPHFSYLGDATLGERVNVGAGTVTANYDGVNKNPTVIEDDCFVGVDTMFVAPRRMGRGSRTGAGSVVTRDIPAGKLAVGVPARPIRKRTP